MSKFTRLTMVLALAVPLGLATAAPAGAAGGTSCKVQKGTATIAPGLGATKKAQKITANVTITGCAGGGVKSGTGTITLTQKSVNCTALATKGIKLALKETIVWNTKKTSTITGTTTTGPKVAQASIAGPVTVGLFKGLKISTLVTFAPNQPAPYCTDAKPLKKIKLTGIKPLVIK